jgi:hypothetical protein
VILAGLKAEHLATRDGHGAITDADQSQTAHDEIDLRFGVEMAGTAERRLVTPCLRAPPGRHGKGLEEGSQAEPRAL